MTANTNETRTTEIAFENFIRETVARDVAGCKAAGTVMDTEWTGEHTAALADFLGCSRMEIDESDLDAARYLYRKFAGEAIEQ